MEFLFGKDSDLLSHGENLVGNVDELLVKNFMETALNGVLYEISDLISDKFALNDFLLPIFSQMPRVQHSVSYLILKYEFALII